MNVRSLCCLCLLLVVATVGHPVASADDAAPQEQKPKPFVLKDEVRDALVPLFSKIAGADVSRVTAAMSAESAVDGAIVDRQESTYQIASQQPNRFTVYLKEPEQRTRIYSDGKSMVVALAPDAYFRLPDAMGTQEASVALPVPMGPYPEPIMALSLAGVDPAVSFLGGMKSVEVIDRNKFRDKTPAIHLRGVQHDLVSWDLWITAEKQPRPLRLLVDMTAMLRASDQVQIPDNFSYQLRVDFHSWRMAGEVDPKLFTYTPPKDATEYESLDDYYQSIAGVVSEHPLLGKPMPTFQAPTLTGDKLESKQLADKVVVIDFWATWCESCVVAIPEIKKITDKFADKDVLFLAVNVGEESAKIKGFLESQKWDVRVLVDSEGKLADAFGAEALPQTVVVGKSGVVESVHIGFLGADQLQQRLTDELQVLSAGGRIASADSDQRQ